MPNSFVLEPGALSMKLNGLNSGPFLDEQYEKSIKIFLKEITFGQDMSFRCRIDVINIQPEYGQIPQQIHLFSLALRFWVLR